MSRIINYNFFHWGPFLYKTHITKSELDSLKKLNTRVNFNSEYNEEHLEGKVKDEYILDVKKVFPIISPYLQSYSEAYLKYRDKILGSKIELMSAWVNYMTKFETIPMHVHHEDLSFVIFIQIPKGLKEEWDNTPSPENKPGAINFMYSLGNQKYCNNRHHFFPEEGDFFIFPADLHHYVNSFKCDGERIAISGNLRVGTRG